MKKTKAGPRDTGNKPVQVEGNAGGRRNGRDTRTPPFVAFVGKLPKGIVQEDVDKLFGGLKIRTILELKTVSPELQLEIMKFFFHYGFCKKRGDSAADNQEKEEEDEPAAKTTNDQKIEAFQKQCVAYFLTVIRKFSSMELISSLYDYIVPIVTGNVADEETIYELLTPLPKKGLRLFNKAGKALAKTSQPMLAHITRVGVLQILTNQDTDMVCFESWLDVVKKAMKKDPNLETIFYILDTVVHEDSSFFNYEASFRLIVMQMQNQVPEEVIQALADAIDPGADTDEDEEDDGDDDIDFDDNGEEDDDDDDDEDDDDDDDDESEKEDAEADSPENNDSQLFSKASAANNGDSDSDATIDLDEATEEDLKKMDMALANVFATKKRMKEQTKVENRTYMRVLHLVDILLTRYKEPPISMALVLLMPLVSNLKNSLQVKGNQDTINRTLSTLKRLNKFTKFSGKEEVDEEILSTMAQEIRQLMKKKFVSKDVKNVLYRSVHNILCCDDEEKGVPLSRKAKKKRAKAKAKAAKKEGNLVVTINGGTATDNVNSKKKKKKKKNKKITTTSDTVEPTITNGDGDSYSTSSTTTTEAKKDKKKKVNKKKKNKKSKVENNDNNSQQEQPQQKTVVVDSVVSAGKPTKRKAPGMSEKKKAKLLRMQVHSEGLINSLD